MEFIEEILWAKKAFATSLESSLLQIFEVIIRSPRIQLEYISTKTSLALRPFGVCVDPIRTRSGSSKSLMAVPSAKNSGFERTSNRMPLSADVRILSMA